MNRIHLTQIGRAGAWVFIVVLCAPTACNRPAKQASADLAGVRLGDLYHQYLRGTAVEAKQALLASVKVIDDSSLDADKKAHAHYMNCSRLYVLCRKTGDDGEAEAYLAETRYWLLRKKELQGTSKRDAGNELRSFDEAAIVAFVERWDQGKTEGKGATYLRGLTKGD